MTTLRKALAAVASDGKGQPTNDLDIPVGSRWRDNDKRSQDRVVRVYLVTGPGDGDFVYYRRVVRARSRRARFLKAFTREPEAI
jgi:hypothetical protein